jgi:hypothetical protein
VSDLGYSVLIDVEEGNPMTGTVLARLIRQPFIWLGIIALVLATLFLLESTGHKQPARSLPVTLSSNGSGTDFGNPGGNPGKHCKNGHGHDDQHNKHCRPASGGQGHGGHGHGHGHG